MKTAVTRILLSSVLLLPAKGFTQTPDSLTQSFAMREQSLADAIGKGDKEVWEYSLHDSCLITVEDGTVVGGFGSSVLEFANEHGYKNELKILGIPDRIIEHGSPKELHRESGYDAPAIKEAVLKMMKDKIEIRTKA